MTRVGLFGLLGAGNFGNDGSLEAILDFLRTHDPDLRLECLCSGPERVRTRYGVPATALHWYYARERSGNRVVAAVCKSIGKAIDPFRTLRWTRSLDVVIVPGTGMLETTLPLRSWGFPYALFQLCLAARLTGTTVAFVNVGASPVRQPLTRWLFRSAARMAHYRSFRDVRSREAMSRMGVDTSRDGVFPDLVFALPEPSSTSDGEGVVGVGVMAFHGSNDERRDAAAIHDSYIAAMTSFVGWLLDTGRRVRLLTGDELDDVVVDEIVARTRAERPAIEESRVLVERVSSPSGLQHQLSSVDLVVGSRYHNVVGALKLGKPTISVSYSEKSDDLMRSMGMGEFCHSARAVDVDRLIEQFTTLEARAGEVQRTILAHSASNALRLEEQFTALSARLFPPARQEVR